MTFIFYCLNAIENTIQDMEREFDAYKRKFDSTLKREQEIKLPILNVEAQQILELVIRTFQQTCFDPCRFDSFTEMFNLGIERKSGVFLNDCFARREYVSGLSNNPVKSVFYDANDFEKVICDYSGSLEANFKFNILFKTSKGWVESLHIFEGSDEKQNFSTKMKSVYPNEDILSEAFFQTNKKSTFLNIMNRKQNGNFCDTENSDFQIFYTFTRHVKKGGKAFRLIVRKNQKRMFICLFDTLLYCVNMSIVEIMEIMEELKKMGIKLQGIKIEGVCREVNELTIKAFVSKIESNGINLISIKTENSRELFDALSRNCKPIIKIVDLTNHKTNDEEIKIEIAKIIP